MNVQQCHGCQRCPTAAVFPVARADPSGPKAARGSYAKGPVATTGARRRDPFSLKMKESHFKKVHLQVSTNRKCRADPVSASDSILHPLSPTTETPLTAVSHQVFHAQPPTTESPRLNRTTTWQFLRTRSKYYRTKRKASSNTPPQSHPLSVYKG